MMANIRQFWGHAESASAALDTSYTALPCTAVAGDPAEEMPDECWLGAAQVVLDTIDTAESVTWYLSEDEAGDVALTPEATHTILDGTTSGAGTVTDTVDIPYTLSGRGTAGTVWIQAKLDAGTANGVGVVRFQRRA